MSQLPPVGEADWGDLARELDTWSETGRAVTLWWRDDDAVAPGPALDRLVAAAGDVPLALAVVPEAAEPALGEALAALPHWRVLQHGWAHRNHAAAGAKKNEFGAERAPDEVCGELAQGRARLGALFGARVLPVLAPPWNRIAEGLVGLLAGVGLVGLSRYGARRRARADIVETNTHVDILDWRRRRFGGEPRALGLLTGHLAARRRGEVLDEPTGILTHHLVHDAAADDFLARLRERLNGVRWLSPAEVFAAP